MAHILPFTRKSIAPDPDRKSLEIFHRLSATGTPDLDLRAKFAADDHFDMEWKPIASAPFNCDLELAIIDYDGHHAPVFPCRRILDGWVNADTKMRIEVRPTHWRDWCKLE